VRRWRAKKSEWLKTLASIRKDESKNRRGLV
jgi:hypothetical protein